MAHGTMDVDCVDDLCRIGRLVSPIRLEILKRAGQPCSATELGTALGMTRQKVNYHVRELAKAKFLRRAGRRRKRGLVEQLWQAGARAYVILPEVLGPTTEAGRSAETSAATYFLALSNRMQRQVANHITKTGTSGELPLLCFDAALTFRDAAERAEFASRLQSAIAGVIADYGRSADADPHTPANVESFHLMVAVCPEAASHP